MGATRELTLDFNYLLDSGSTIEQSVNRGPVLTFTRASDQGDFGSDGNWALVGSNDLPVFGHDPANSDAQLGLLGEMEARTNEALHNQDLPNAVWVESNVTTAKDATGIDGVSNSASTLTATSANGTVLQTVTKSSAANTYSVLIKRKTGTGDIDITDNNGTNWTTLTGLSSSDWTRHDITRTQANPVFGIRIVTDTDAVEVDMNQLEAGSYRTSIIPTTTASVTRAKCVLSTTDLTWFNTAAQTFAIVIASFVDSGAGYLSAVHAGGQQDLIALLTRVSDTWNTIHNTTTGSDGTVVDPGTGITYDGTPQKLAMAFADSDMQAAGNGVTGTQDTSITAPSTNDPTTFQIGARNGDNEPSNLYFQSFKSWNIRKIDAFLVTETT